MVTKARQLAEFIANADVDSDEIATGAVSASKLADTLDLSSKTIVMPDVAAFNITSGDVGIGTASPLAPLHVDIATNSEIARFKGADAQLRINNDTSNEIQLLSSGSGDDMTFATNSTERMRITSGGRVGIKNTGTDISGTSLDDVVIGAGTTVAGLVLDGGASNDTAYGFANAGTKVGRIQYINSSNSMVFQTDNANRMAIDGSGNVGIGTTSPAESLDIAGGSIRIGNSKIRHSGSGGSWDMAFETYSGGYFERMRIDSVGNVGVGTTSPSELLDVNNGSIRAGSSTTYFADTAGGDRYIGVAATGGGDAMFIAHSSGYGLAYFGYNAAGDRLIIGTDNGGGNNKIDFITSAGTSANVNNIDGVSPVMRIQANGDVRYGIGNSHTPLIQGVTNNGRIASSPGYSFNGDLNTGMFQPATFDTIAFATAGTERMRITSDGKVIVGDISTWNATWSARTPFQVNGGAVAHQTQSNGGSTIFSNNFYQNAGDRAISTGYSQGIVMNPTGSGAIRVLTTSGINTAGNSFSFSQGPYVAAGGSSWTNGSDERLKNITGEISNGLSKVATLRAAEYTWNDDETNKPQVGLIAQDIQAVLPEVVSSIQMRDNDDTEYLGIAYDQVIPLLVAALKEAKEKIETLESRVEALEG